MKSAFRILISLLSILTLTNCASLSTSATENGKKVNKAHSKFQKRSDYKKTYDIFRDESLLNQATRQNTRVHINLTNQRAQLYVNELVALDSPCTTGKPGKRTPTGTFRITEKIVAKRSTIFGSLYKNGKKVYGGDRRKYRGSYDKYVGSALPYWMRLTGDGIGMHSSRGIRRYPASNGCIRFPSSAVKTVYSKTKVGTRVSVAY